MKRFLEIFREKMAPLINRKVEDYASEAVKEWLTEKLKDNQCCAECDSINRFIKTDLLGEFQVFQFISNKEVEK